MKFYIVDAFTENLFGGNPAGVVILEEGCDFPSGEAMKKTAAELRYSETAFIKKIGGDKFDIRYFTPADEVDLCGHATVGSFWALLDAGSVKEGGSYRIHTLAGELTVKVQHGFVMMEMAAPECIKKIQDPAALEELYAVLGIPCESVAVQQSCSQYVRLLPMIVSTGLPDIILPVKDRQTLEAVSPDFKALSDLSQRYQAVGVHAFTLDRNSYDVTAHCRNFAPLYGIDEEAATGTSNGALTYYLFAHDLIPDEKECAFIQGEAMGRPSKILTHIKQAGDRPRIQVGGSAAILACGTIYL